jgi:aminoglycoside phosphotransferase (APT) family kinase protein|tara:strand:- start:40304 stop:40801 length:498 start_codon:yes stop_codon:yes gene_type:complete
LIPDDVNLSPAFAELSQWLATNIPIESDACIVHNDFRIGNVMWKATGPTQLLTVLDWELATLGDPLFDLAYFINCYPGHGIPRTPTQDLAAAVLEDGYLEPADLIARYVVGRGRDVSNVKWNQVFVDWKLAILYEYSRLRGGDDYYQQGGLVERFLHAALRHIAS